MGGGQIGCESPSVRTHAREGFLFFPPRLANGHREWFTTDQNVTRIFAIDPRGGSGRCGPYGRVRVGARDPVRGRSDVPHFYFSPGSRAECLCDRRAGPC